MRILGDVVLPQMTSEKDLGILVDVKLDWKECVETVVKKAKQTVGWVSRNVISRSMPVMLNIYKNFYKTSARVLCSSVVTQS